jgi:hypothetical protein
MRKRYIVICGVSGSTVFFYSNSSTARLRREDNIKTDIRDVGCGCVDWIGLAQDRDKWRALVSAVMNHRVP